MPWTAAKFGDVGRVNGVASVLVVFVNDVNSETFTRTLTIDGEPENLKRQVAAEIARANAVDSQAAAITKDQAIDTSPATPQLSPLQEFTRNFQALARLKRAIDLGVLAADAKVFTDLLAKVQGEWVNGYEFQAMI